MKMFFLVLAALVSLNAESQPKNSMIEQVKVVVEKAWRDTIRPHQPGVIWESRISDPIPGTWPPKENDFVFYAYARGVDHESLKDGEYVGRVWAKIVINPKPELSFLSKELVRTEETVGVRPLSSKEIEILRHDPMTLLRAKPSNERDQQIKAYYCLQKSLGNVPPEVIDRHSAFFEWLSCDRIIK